MYFQLHWENEAIDQEKIFTKYMSDKGLVTKKYKELLISTIKRKTTQLKWPTDFRRHFTKRNMWIADKHMKRCSLSLVITAIQIKIKIIMKYHYILTTSMFIIKKTATKGCRTIGTLKHCYWKCKMIQSFWAKFGSFWKTKHIATLHPKIPLLDIYSWEIKAYIHKVTCG